MKIAPDTFPRASLLAVPPATPGRRSMLALCGLAVLAAAWRAAPAVAAETAVVVPPPASDMADARGGSQTAVFAGGFWGVQGVFQHVEGVSGAVSGYAGGERASADYETVSSGRTDHAEAVRVTFDPKRVSYGQLLQIYFSVAHDPTELDRQGPDTGRQYRSAIFPADARQQRVARAYIAQLDAAKVFGRRIATTIEAGKTFYPAEARHQDYLTRHPDDAYIATYDLPKLDNLRRVFPRMYRMRPALVGTSA
jgi:peptide-methionine (S)-S-oxide reductase